MQSRLYADERSTDRLDMGRLVRAGSSCLSSSSCRSRPMLDERTERAMDRQEAALSLRHLPESIDTTGGSLSSGAELPRLE